MFDSRFILILWDLMLVFLDFYMVHHKPYIYMRFFFCQRIHYLTLFNALNLLNCKKWWHRRLITNLK